ADKRIYALRDVTATVESLPLICGSIMSKKLAEGIDGLVLDVKFGNGAFMKSAEQAEELALALAEIGRGYGKKVTCLLTDMNQPLGRYSGNALETFECVEIMSGKTFVNSQGRDLYADVRELSLQLSAHMLLLGNAARDLHTAYEMALATLQDGRALRKFHEICEAQGGDLTKLPTPTQSYVIQAPTSGFVSKMETEKLGIVGIMIKAGRSKTTDVLDLTAGIEYHAKIGDQVQAGQPLLTLYGNSKSLLAEAAPLAQSSVTISLQKQMPPILIKKILQ
ncbi:MAG TPA: thymidine phosphorylase, partial [Pseudobdellovibrionaceae bacterium]|nr:thymidine phosphorylase [Pseudobdellovibrionaceae bacterium]